MGSGTRNTGVNKKRRPMRSEAMQTLLQRKRHCGQRSPPRLALGHPAIEAFQMLAHASLALPQGFHFREALARQSNQPLESKDDIALITRSRFDRVILEPTIANAFQQFEALVSRK